VADNPSVAQGLAALQAYIGAGPRCVLMARNGMRYDPLRLPFLQAA
jgi:hypothetical protein